MASDRVKGHLDLLLLAVLQDGPMHGYAVITALRDRSAGQFDLAEGSIYPALHRLEDGGSVSSEWQQVSGRRRRVYRLTPAGSSALDVQRRDWRSLMASIELVLRPAALTPALP